MPKVLIVAATQQEIEPFLNRFKIEPGANVGFFVSAVNPGLAVLITGVGMVNTAYYMGRYFLSAFNYTFNAGICGAFNRNIKIGEVVNVVEDSIAEMGAQDGDNFIKYQDLNLGGAAIYTSRSFDNIEDFEKLKKVKGITVNSVHGNDESIKKTVSLFSPDIESMEGAGFLRGCEHLPGNCYQIRSVSNYVEKRDKSKWDIPLAVNNLNELLIKVVEDLQK
jgi:futalosine hydrolase